MKYIRVLFKFLCTKGTLLSLLAALLVSCQGRSETGLLNNFAPAPIVTPAPAVVADSGGSGVGASPVPGVQPTSGIPGPVGAPTTAPGPNPGVNPPITLPGPVPTLIPITPATPAPTPTPPGPNTGSLTVAGGGTGGTTGSGTTTASPSPNGTTGGTAAGTGTVNGVTLNLTATVPLGVQSRTPIFDISIRNLTQGTTAAVSAAELAAIPTLDPAGIAGSTSLATSFTLPFSNTLINSFNTGDSLVVTLRLLDTAGRVLNLETAPFPANINRGAIPPPPAFAGTVIDQVTLTASSFLLTQTGDTGVVGFGPNSGTGSITADFGGTGSSATTPLTSNPCGRNSFFTGGALPFFLVDQRSGGGIFVNSGTLAPTTIQRNPVTLSGQRLTISANTNNVLTATISPSNFDEIYRLNFFESRNIQFIDAICTETPSSGTPPGPSTFTLTFNQRTSLIGGVLSSVNGLFTLRGTNAGNTEPNQSGGGRLQGAQFTSDRPLPSGLISTADPRFAGVLNLRDPSGNQIRTDIAIVFDQIQDQQTQAAVRDLPLGPNTGNVASGRPPFTTANGCPATAGSGLVCGRFQFNQPFAPTAGPDGTGNNPDVLVISGTFTGKIAPTTTASPTP